MLSSLSVFAPKQLPHVGINYTYPDAHGDKLGSSFHWKCLFAMTTLQMKETDKDRTFDSLTDLLIFAVSDNSISCVRRVPSHLFEGHNRKNLWELTIPLESLVSTPSHVKTLSAALLSSRRNAAQKDPDSLNMSGRELLREIYMNQPSLFYLNYTKPYSQSWKSKLKKKTHDTKM